MSEAAQRTRYVLLVRVPREIEVRIEDAFLTLVGTTRPLMGYHITLLGPFYLPSGVDYHALKGIEQVCQNWPPFYVRLDGLGAFRSKDNNAIYIRLLEATELVALHNALWAVLQNQIILQNEQTFRWNTQNYEPHITLGLGLLDEELEQLLHLGEERSLEESFLVQEIWLAGQASDGPWQYLLRYPLGLTQVSGKKEEQHPKKG